jgi:hypothetical protein
MFSRRVIVASGTAVMVFMVASGLLYAWRWRSCYSESELKATNEVVTEIFGDDSQNADQFGKPHDEQVARWIDELTRRYPERSDSWSGVEEAARDAHYRIWSAPPEPRIFKSTEQQRFCTHTLDLRYPRKSLHAECRSEDERFKIFCVLSDVPAIRRLTFEDHETKLKGSLEFYEIGFWQTLIDFEGIHYRLVASVDDFYEDVPVSSGRTSHELNWATHSYRFLTQEKFLETSLYTLDELEERIRKLLDSDDPMLSGFRSVPNVDVIRCTCEFEYPPADRKLTDDEKATVLADALTELNRRRDLLREHHVVWFEMLKKVLVE